MRGYYSNKKPLLFKRITFLICSFVITCSTHLEESAPHEIPKIVFSRADKGLDSVVQDPVVFPDSDIINSAPALY